MTHPDPRAAYVREEKEHRAQVEAARRASIRIGTVRVVTFLALAAALVMIDVQEGTGERVAWILSVVLGLVFVAEVSLHRRVRRRERWHETLAGLAHEGILRLERRWKDLAEALPKPERVREDAPAGHPWARDLDVLGDASLVRLLGPVTSERGRGTLRGWLMEAFEPERASRRQEAVRELAPERDLRAAVAAHGRLDSPRDLRGVAPFLIWAESGPWIPRWMRWAAWALPALLLALAAAQHYLGWPPLWILPALAQVEIIRRYGRRIADELEQVEQGGLPLPSYVPQVAAIEVGSWKAPCLAEIQAELARQTLPASFELRRLARMLETVESRRNWGYALFAPVLLLDVHLAAALDRWRMRSGGSVRIWLEALGRWEALSALATAAHDHPDWGFARFVEGEPAVLRATALGHPLLKASACVRNDVEVGPAGTFLLVTGSNMSGKSTLLRALGANVLLAGAGGPVCAEALELPRLRVRTSMRIDDSVTEGVSLFMAELLRIRDVVAAADDGTEAVPVLYLLDEILHGTNTAERQVAARAVIRHLLTKGAIGAVSTHDLTLAEAPDLEAAAVSVHFREQVVPGEDGRTRLTFDYRLRPGLATTRNALKLLDAVGLGGLEGLRE